MKIDLRRAEPNPFRDFKIDPTDEKHVLEIRASIKKDGLWGGIVARLKAGTTDTYEIMSGWHRVMAGIAEGYTEVDVHVGEYDDEAAVRIYARENATQRGDVSTAVVGSVAAAIRQIQMRELLDVKIDSQKHRGGDRGRNGVGRDAILEELRDVPGINDTVVRQHLSNLKASGDYDRIVDETIALVEKQQAFELEALRKAEEARAEAERREAEAKDADERKAAEKARKAAEAEEAKHAEAKHTREATAKAKARKQHEITFDLTGVQKHLDKPSHVETFKRLCLKHADMLPVANQAQVAEAIVKEAGAAHRDEQYRGEVSIDFIEDTFLDMLAPYKMVQGDIDRADRKRQREEELREMAWNEKVKRLQTKASTYAISFRKAISDLVGMEASRPKGVTVLWTPSFDTAMHAARTGIKLAERELGYWRRDEKKPSAKPEEPGRKALNS